MKKLFLTLIAVAVGALSSFAQDDLVATLSHGSDLSTFSGQDALTQAYEAAEDGDVITLSPGVFSAVSIDKAITIRGAGFKPMASNGYISTQISGEMTITLSPTAASVFEMEGVQTLGKLVFKGENQASVKLSKCRCKEVNCYDVSMNTLSCIFDDGLWAKVQEPSYTTNIANTTI